MIKKIQIQNFQSHKDTTLEFSNGVNIIVGTTDSGKSAIIRALRWVFFNKPMGESFRSTWKGDTSVQVLFSNGQIERKRTNNFNGYILGDSEFKALKSEIPKEISDFLNVNNINLQSQGDNFFLLSNTSGEVASHFNKIANLDTIDIANRNIKSWASNVSKRLNSLEETFKEKQKELLQYDYIDKFEVDLEVIENDSTKLKEFRKNITKLTSLLSSINEINIELEEESIILEIETDLNSIFSLKDKINQLNIDYENLSFLLGELNQNEKSINVYSKYIKIESTLEEIQNLINEKKEIEKEKDILENLLYDLSLNLQEIKIKEKLYDRLHKEFEDNMPDICPLCNN